MEQVIREWYESACHDADITGDTDDHSYWTGYADALAHVLYLISKQPKDS